MAFAASGVFTIGAMFTFALNTRWTVNIGKDQRLPRALRRRKVTDGVTLRT